MLWMVGMLNKTSLTSLYFSFISGFLVLPLSGCFDSSSSKQTNSDRENTAWVFGPSNMVWSTWQDGPLAAFKDTHAEPDTIAGTVWVKPQENDETIAAFQVAWYDTALNQVVGEPLAYVSADTLGGAAEFGLVIAATENLQPQAQLELHQLDAQNQVVDTEVLAFHDFKGNVGATGPGGHLEEHWEYGSDRPGIPVHQFGSDDNKTCRWDNGFVQVTDMANKEDDRKDIVVDDLLYPAFEFDCTDTMRNTHRTVWWDDAETEISTYSALNDAMYYGTLVYDAFYRYLGRAPWQDKLRLRVHYGYKYKFPFNATWDGAYANFSDNVFDGYGTTSLDVIAHEIGHGFLSHNTPLVRNGEDFPKLVRTIHEAFSDITSVVVKNHVNGEPHWIMGEELKTSQLRYLNQIITQEGAYQSALDLDVNEGNPYLSIGMLTYPFYELTQKWGIDRAYSLYLHSAMSCWDLTSTLQTAAECILASSKHRGDRQQDVIDAFKTVKIRLYDEGSMAHFTVEKKKRDIQFVDTSVTTNQIESWKWMQNDTIFSKESAPEFSYEEGGTKKVTLEITDAFGQTDTFTREFSVFEQYCEPWNNNSSGIPDRHIQSVQINGQEIPIQDPYQYDFTDELITVDRSKALSIKVTGERKGDALIRSTQWRIWLDVNDDGEWHKTEELWVSMDKSIDDAYVLELTDVAWPTNLDAGPLRMRLVADYVVSDPCRVMKDVTKDFLLTPF